MLKVGGWSYCVYILEWNCIVFLWLGVYATYTDVYTTPLYHVAGYPITSRVSSYCPVVTLVVAHSLPPTPDIYLEYEQYHAVVCFKADPLHKFTICLSYSLWHMSPLAWNFIDLCGRFHYKERIFSLLIHYYVGLNCRTNRLYYVQIIFPDIE